MNVTEYMVQQANEFNNRVDEIQELLKQMTDRLRILEYNIERLEHGVQVLTDTLPLALPKHTEGDDIQYEKYIQRT